MKIQSKRLNKRISSQKYIKSLKGKAFKAIYEHFLKHFGHKNSKIQADTLKNYQMSRKFLVKWV